MFNNLYLSLLTFSQPNMLHISNIDFSLTSWSCRLKERVTTIYKYQHNTAYICTYITKDGQTTQSKRYTVGNLQLKIISTHTTTLREWSVLNSWFIAFINNLRLPYNICACIKSSFYQFSAVCSRTWAFLLLLFFLEQNWNSIQIGHWALVYIVIIIHTWRWYIKTNYNYHQALNKSDTKSITKIHATLLLVQL